MSKRKKKADYLTITFNPGEWKTVKTLDGVLTDRQLETVANEINAEITKRRRSIPRAVAVIDTCPELLHSTKPVCDLTFWQKLRRFIKRLRFEIRKAAVKYSDYPRVRCEP